MSLRFILINVPKIAKTIPKPVIRPLPEKLQVTEKERIAKIYGNESRNYILEMACDDD